MKIIKIISEIKNRPPIKLVKIREIRGKIALHEKLFT